MACTILGIESSCDETAAAVVSDGHVVHSNVIATQYELHERYTGVVPEIASRAHLERIGPVIESALAEAGMTFASLDAVAVGHQPGLIGSLLTGVSAAKALAWSIDRPLVGVDHLHAHLWSPCLDADPLPMPALGLVASGGHTNLCFMPDPLTVEPLGRTIDDAIGEAFDKAAVLLGLGWPGGAALDALAAEGDPHAVQFPVSRLDADSLDFSYSGLKTALLHAVRGRPVGRGRDATFERDGSELTPTQRADLAASFQHAAVSALRLKIERALDRVDVHALVIGGGVSANSHVRSELQHCCDEAGIELRLPAPQYCMDNAAMIAGLAHPLLDAGRIADATLSAAARSCN